MRIVIIVLTTALLTYIATRQLQPSANVVSTSDTIIVKGDSIPYPVVINSVPEIKETIHDTLWQNNPIDTLAILSQYFAVNLYSDTFRKDSSYVLILTEKVSQNRIINRNIALQNLREKQIIINNIVANNSNGIYVGGYVGFKTFGVEGMYLKNNKAYGVGYGNNGAYIKLSIKIY